jgi:hypothetical protein
MAKVRVVCRGLSPLLLDPATDHLVDNLITGVNPGKDRRPAEEQAKSKLLINEQGDYYIPATWLYASLREAGREVDYKPRIKITSNRGTKLFSFLVIEEENLVLTDSNGGKPSWKTDKRKGVNPNGGEAVAICRPRFDDWGFSCNLEVGPEITLDKVRTLFEIAGKHCGLGSFRPQKGGPFGRFQVVKWEVY